MIFRRKPKLEDVDPMEFVRRVEAMRLRHEEVVERGRSALKQGDTEAVTAAFRESDLILANLRDLRLEQLACQEEGWKRP